MMSWRKLGLIGPLIIGALASSSRRNPEPEVSTAGGVTTRPPLDRIMVRTEAAGFRHGESMTR